MTIDSVQPQGVEWCSICRPHKAGHCDGCGDAFRPGEAHYRSQSYHYHPAAIGGLPGFYAIHSEFCVVCYRKDHAAVYPQSEVPELPDRPEVSE